MPNRENNYIIGDRIRSVYASLWLLLVVLGAAAVASPAMPDTLASFSHRAWRLKDGAPPDIWALAQSSDGYLWLGTGSGLYRFDGITFEHFRLPVGQYFPSTNITALTILPSGDMWIG